MAENVTPYEALEYHDGAFGLSILSGLYKAVYGVLALSPTSSHLNDLRKAFHETNVAICEAKALEHIYDRAQDKYECADGGREITVVGDMTHSNEEDGFWVDAWLYVPAKKGEIEDYDPDENDDEEDEDEQ